MVLMTMIQTDIYDKTNSNKIIPVLVSAHFDMFRVFLFKKDTSGWNQCFIFPTKFLKDC